MHPPTGADALVIENDRPPVGAGRPDRRKPWDRSRTTPRHRPSRTRTRWGRTVSSSSSICHPEPAGTRPPVQDDGLLARRAAPLQERDALSAGRHQFRRQRGAGFLRGAVREPAWPLRARDGLSGGRREARLRARPLARRQAGPDEGRAQWNSNIPAIEGIGGLQIYLVDRYGAKGSIYDVDFEWLGEPDPKPARRRPPLHRPPDPQRLSRPARTNGPGSTSGSSTSARSATSTSRAR